MKKTLALLLLTSTAYADDPAPPDAKPAEETTQEEVKTAVTAAEPAALVQPSTTDSVSVTKAAEAPPAKALDLGDVRFELHGYARMPLATQGTPREPYLVDNDYYLSGFSYTRLYEPDWSELFF